MTYNVIHIVNSISYKCITTYNTRRILHTAWRILYIAKKYVVHTSYDIHCLPRLYVLHTFHHTTYITKIVHMACSVCSTTQYCSTVHVYSVYCKMYIVHCMPYTVYCTAYSINCKMYNVHCILYAAN